MRYKWGYLAFGALFLALTLAAGPLFSLLGTSRTALPAKGEEEILLIFDAGHGGVDGGTTGVNGVKEKELNLEMSRLLAELFRAAGYAVIETRTDDRMLNDGDGRQGHLKQSDLNARLALSVAHPGSLFISLHMNSYPLSGCRGLQVWYSEAHPISKELAMAVQSGVSASLQPDNNRQVKAATSSIFLLKKAQNPAILIECGFLSNPAECDLLCDENYRQRLALTIFSSLSEKLRPATCENG